MKINTNVKIIAVSIAMIGILTLTGCGNEADNVSYNLSQESDNFNVVRQLTVVNCITGDLVLQMTGKLSITADREDNQLEVVIENDDGTYKKDIVGLADNVLYNVEDVKVTDVSKYKYKLNFNPKMWVPIEAGVID